MEQASNSNINYSHKRIKLDHNSPVAKFKGVVPQQNGRWGAQIYANHQRIWLGTFRSEKEAAMAYDSAAIKLRNGEPCRNFPVTSRTIRESCFQEHYSTESVLEMIRDGSYEAKFCDFLNIQSQLREIKGNNNNDNNNNNNNNNNNFTLHGDEHFSCRQLFQKELTPSDVGKLNRLVVPKKFAVKYFPFVSECFHEKGNRGGGGIDDIELIFYDKLTKLWKFRYCYWRSSQSFVFTRGWNRFVKEKNLKEKDVIKFYSCQYKEKATIDGGKMFSLIDVCYNGSKNKENRGFVKDERIDSNLNLEPNNEKELALELRLGKVNKEINVTHNNNNNAEENGFRLFGVQIK